MLNSRSKESEDEIAIRADELKERRRFLMKNNISQQSNDWDLLLYGPHSETDRPRYDALNSTLVEKEDYLDRLVAAEKAAKAAASQEATQQTNKSPAQRPLSPASIARVLGSLSNSHPLQQNNQKFNMYPPLSLLSAGQLKQNEEMF